ncbi:lysozyme inhibitor LprI family protein [Pseudomonas nicosulfuronedens]
MRMLEGSHLLSFVMVAVISKVKIVVGFLLLFCAAVYSKEEDYQEGYDSCVSKHAEINNMIIGSCSERISEDVFSQINNRLKELRDMYSENAPEDIERLNKSQESWLLYRNAQCDLEGSHIGSPMLSLCPMQKNIQRLKEINGLLQE